MKKPWFPFYVQDWLVSNSTRLMELDQQAAYLNLICFAWKSGDCGLPMDDKSLAKLSGLGRKWNKKKKAVLEQFSLIDGRIYDIGLLYEFQNVHKKKLSPAKRWYRAYLKSDWWKALRKKAVALADNTCQKCGAKERIEVHHKSYRHVKTEQEINDLIVLCRTCHRAEHGLKHAV